MDKSIVVCLVFAAAAAGHVKPGSLSVKTGTVYTVGQKVTLSWTASIDHNKSNYDLWFSSDSGKSWTSVKTGIPGQTAGVLVNYAWTVPNQPTTKGMLRVFQIFGGTVATDPSNPGSYTLFSPIFQIKATSAIQTPTSSRALAAVRTVGDHLLISFKAPAGRTASLDILRLDGTLVRTLRLSPIRAGDNRLEQPLSDLGTRGRSILRLRVDGQTLALESVGPFN